MMNGNYLYPILPHQQPAPQAPLPQMPSPETQTQPLPDAFAWVMQQLQQHQKTGLNSMLGGGGQMQANPSDPQTGLNSFGSSGLLGNFGSSGIGGLLSSLF